VNKSLPRLDYCRSLGARGNAPWDDKMWGDSREPIRGRKRTAETLLRQPFDCAQDSAAGSDARYTR